MPRPVSNPPNPWESTSVEWLGPPPTARLEVFEETARSALTRNDSPDVPFRWSVNPYRGCQHACAYCYARGSHTYLSFGAGTDFEKKLVVKVNLPTLLRRELAAARMLGEWLHFSGVTDPYQPLEASYRLTRRCLEVARRFGNPVCIITKSGLVQRDAELLGHLAREAGARVFLSIPFADPEDARRMEPGAPGPQERFRTLATLTRAGVETGVAIAPLIPGLNESAIPTILRRAREAGASSAFLTLLRLPGQVDEVFRERLHEAFPGRARRVLRAHAEMRGEGAHRRGFGERMTGVGSRWKSIEELFRLTARKLGYRSSDEGATTPLRPVVRGLHAGGQGELFVPERGAPT